MTFKAKWEKEEVYGMSPPPRTSHTSVVYKQNYLIIIGGEGYNDSKYIPNLISIKLRPRESPPKRCVDVQCCHKILVSN